MQLRRFTIFATLHVLQPLIEFFHHYLGRTVATVKSFNIQLMALLAPLSRRAREVVWIEISCELNELISDTLIDCQ